MILALEIDDPATMDFFKSLAWKSKIHHYTYDPMDASNYENKKLKEINGNLESSLTKSLHLLKTIDKLTTKLTLSKPDPEPIPAQAIPIDKLNMVNTTGLVKELKYVKRKYIPIDPIKCEDGDIILGIYLPSVITSPEQSGLGASLLKVKDTTQDTDYYSGNDDDDEKQNRNLSCEVFNTPDF